MGLPVSLAFKGNNPRTRPKGKGEYATTIPVFNPLIYYNGPQRHRQSFLGMCKEKMELCDIVP